MHVLHAKGRDNISVLIKPNQSSYCRLLRLLIVNRDKKNIVVEKDIKDTIKILPTKMPRGRKKMSTKRSLSPTQLEQSKLPPSKKNKKAKKPTTTTTVIFPDTSMPMIIPFASSTTTQPVTKTMPLIAEGWKIIIHKDEEGEEYWTLDPKSVSNYHDCDIRSILEALEIKYRPQGGYYHPAMMAPSGKGGGNGKGIKRKQITLLEENLAHEDGLRKFLCRKGIPGVPAQPNWDELFDIDSDDEDEEEDDNDKMQADSDDEEEEDEFANEKPEVSLHKWIAFANVPIVESKIMDTLPTIRIPTNEEAIQWLIEDYGFHVDTENGTIFRWRTRDGGVDYLTNVEQLRRYIQGMDETILLEQPNDPDNDDPETTLTSPERRTTRRRRTKATTTTSQTSTTTTSRGSKRGRGRVDDNDVDDEDDYQDPARKLIALRLWATLSPAPLPVFGDEHAEQSFLPVAAISSSSAAAARLSSSKTTSRPANQNDNEPETQSSSCIIL